MIRAFLAVDDAGELRRLEASLWRDETRFDRVHMERILAPDFVEIGCSGRAYTRDEIIALEPQPIAARLPLREFRPHPLADGIVLITYISETGEDEVRICRRSSLWIATPAGWRLRFHQGTPVDRSPSSNSAADGEGSLEGDPEGPSAGA
jgi:hypothetical protein